VGALGEKAGIPAVSIVSEQFVDLVKISARAQGIPSLAVAVIPHRVLADRTVDVRPYCEKAVEEIIRGLTEWQPPQKVDESGEKLLTFAGRDFQDAVDRMNDHFLAQMWGDGFPLVPPTRERVEWLLTGTDLPRDQVLTRRFPPRNGLITVENVAINAAMAGARPEYMPVLLAAVEALATEAGLRIVNALTSSVTNQAPVLIVNGPIAGELNINASYGLMGPGWQANATIGRTISLLQINGAGAYFKRGGNLACQSIPGRYSWCFAENESQNPWPPLHVELGYGADKSTVTVMAGKGTVLIFLQPPAEKILRMIAHSVQGISAREYAVPWDQLLVLSPSHARTLADAGLSKQDIQNFVFENARISLAEGEATGFLFRHSEAWAKRVNDQTDRKTLIPMTERPEDLKIIVAGGPGCISSTFIPALKGKVTGEIDPYKPSRWNQLINAAPR
jgi:hypothetical protein